MLNPYIIDKLRMGCVIPAHPLALNSDKKLDEAHQKALTRYYISSGAGGLAVGVHTTQFAIQDSKVGLYQTVLELAAETARKYAEIADCSEPVMIAGIVGDTENALKEAKLAVETGYHIGLLSLKDPGHRPAVPRI